MAVVPVIDIAPFLNGDEGDKTRVVEDVDTACREIGFLLVAGHGVSADLIRNMYDVSADYFALPFWEKMQFKMPPDRYRGYTPWTATAATRPMVRRHSPTAWTRPRRRI